MSLRDIVTLIIFIAWIIVIAANIGIAVRDISDIIRSIKKRGADHTCETCYANDMEHDEVDNPCWNCKGDYSEWMPKEGADHA